MVIHFLLNMCKLYDFVKTFLTTKLDLNITLLIVLSFRINNFSKIGE